MIEAIISIDSLAPPFTTVPARPKFDEVILIGLDPGRKSIVVISRRNPPIAAGGRDVKGLVDVNGAVGSVDLLCDDDIAIPSWNLSEWCEGWEYHLSVFLLSFLAIGAGVSGGAAMVCSVVATN